MPPKNQPFQTQKSKMSWGRYSHDSPENITEEFIFRSNPQQTRNEKKTDPFSSQTNIFSKQTAMYPFLQDYQPYKKQSFPFREPQREKRLNSFAIQATKTASSKNKKLSKANAHRPSSQSSWNRESQIGTRSRVLAQYQRHFSDHKNIFYSETALMKENDLIDYLWKKTIFLFLVVFIIWYLIVSIKPYSKQCPRHATCGAYINCHEGYALNRQLQICEIDPRIKESGLVIMNGIIQDMKYQYGQKQCTIPKNAKPSQIQEHLTPPKKSLGEIYKNLGIDSEEFKLLKKVLEDYFNNENMQKLSNFKKDSMERIYPTQKSYRLSCRINIFYENNFIGFAVLCLFLALLTFWLIVKLKRTLYLKKGKDIYNFLKAHTLQKQQIYIENFSVELRRKFNYNLETSSEYWLLVNDFRIKQQLIGCYEYNSQIVWRSL